MREAVRSEAKLAESGLYVEGDDTTLRGLESATKEGRRGKRRRRINAYEAVFVEIDLQEEYGIWDEDAIADAYFECSELCQFTAEMIAKQDEVDAKTI